MVYKKRKVSSISFFCFQLSLLIKINNSITQKHRCFLWWYYLVTSCTFTAPISPKPICSNNIYSDLILSAHIMLFPRSYNKFYVANYYLLLLENKKIIVAINFKLKTYNNLLIKIYYKNITPTAFLVREWPNIKNINSYTQRVLNLILTLSFSLSLEI